MTRPAVKYDGDDFKRAVWFLGAQSRSVDTNRYLRCSLCEWVVATPSAQSGSLRLLTAHGVLRRTNHCCLRTLLTTARISRMVADRSHDSTPVVDDGRTSTHPVGRSLLATPFRAPSRSFDLRRRAVSIVSRSAKRGSFRVTPDLLLVSIYLDQYRLASSRDV